MSIRSGRSPRHVVVVGSGAAGLVTALELLRSAPEVVVTVVTKGALDESNTRYAQGGIAAAVMPGDSVESHVSDTLAAGAGLSDAEAVRVLCSEGPAAIDELVRWGVAFDRVGGHSGPFDAGLEGAHSYHRILHAGGDASGAVVERSLVRAALAASASHDGRLELVEHAFLLDLVLAEDTVAGVRLLVDGRMRELRSDAVVLATGGLGQLYPLTTNPAVTTGDGAAAALRAGAVLRDVEFVQFHPTALALPGSFLVSEAVRGDGAVLVNAAGVRFMPEAHPLAELAPRDVVARAIAAQMATGSPVYLDATGLGREELARRFPTIDAASRAAGFDWAVEPLPVAPAAHYWMGGIATDLDARTSLPGLWAVGEVASTGVHGANRLASNSLLEAVVFARRAAAALAGAPRESLAVDALAGAAGTSREPVAVGALPVAAGMSREALHEWMWEAAGLHRSAGPLLAAQAALAADAALAARPGATDAVIAASVHDLETANLRLLGAAVVHGALAREESRGAHFRSDFPHPRPEVAHHIPVTLADLAAASPPIPTSHSARV